jgi:hypothetical protein
MIDKNEIENINRLEFINYIKIFLEDIWTKW